MITQGYTLTANGSVPGLRSIWVANVAAKPFQEEGVISSGFIGPTAGTWFELEATNEAEWTSTIEEVDAGTMVNTTLNYNIHTLSQDDRDLLSLLVKNKDLSVVTQHNDGSMYFLSHSGLTFTSGSITTTDGVLTFSAQDERLPREVIDFIVDIASELGNLKFLTIDGTPITIGGKKLLVYN